MKKNIYKYIMVFAAFIPFFLEFTNLIAGWEGKWVDSVYMLLALLVCIFLVWRRYKEAVSTDFAGALIPALICLAIAVTGYRCSNQAFCYVGTILFGWSIVWMAFGWRMFYRLFPVPLLMLLGLPTHHYYYLFPGITVLWKVAIACALCLYALFALLTDFNPIRRRTALFAVGVILYALLYAAMPTDGSTLLDRYHGMIKPEKIQTDGTF